MFKLKPGNVFQKINQMDRKQAYTWGAIIVVCFVALVTLASFMGNADESSFDGFNTRGYDLAQMPFLNDEAEEYLLASKYPDMQGNNSTMLYSAAEKEARQEEDAAAAAEEDAAAASESSSADSYTGGGYTGGYSGGGYSGATPAAPTQVGQLDKASVSHASGSGVNTSWGAPRGDFSPYESQEKGSEEPVAQLKNQDARRALSQFAQTSRAAAGLRDSKAANAKRALMGGHIQGSEAFTETGVDLSKSGGLALDTNAPVSSADLSNLDDAVNQAAQKGKDQKDEATTSMEDRLLEQVWSSMISMGMQAVGNLLNTGINALQGSIAGNRAFNKSLTDSGMAQASEPVSDANEKLLVEQFGADKVAKWREDNPNGLVWQCQSDLSGSQPISRIPTAPVEPKKSDFATSSSSSSDSADVSSDDDIVLGRDEQAAYDKKMKQYQQEKKEYDKYMNSDAAGKRKIEEKRVKLEQNRKAEVSAQYADFFSEDAKIAKSDAYLKAVDLRDATRASYTKKWVNTNNANSDTENTNTTNGSSGANNTQNSQAWWAQYGDYGDASKYDQAAVANCQNHAAPAACLENTKKK